MGLASGIVVLFVMVLNAAIGSIVLIPLAMPLLFLWKPAYHACVDLVKKYWFTSVVMLLEGLGGIKLFAYGDVMPDEHALIISNHKTRIDWMMLWMYFIRCTGQRLRCLRIVLRGDIKKLPFFGWAMTSFRFFFLSRSWAADQQELAVVCNYMAEHCDRGSVLIFPEGTNLHPKALEKSIAYANERGIPVLKEVLYPKSTGTHFLLSRIRDGVDAVWDVTMGYKDPRNNNEPSEMDLANGRFPQEVHVLAERFPIAQIPRDEEGLKQWLNERFQAKEKALQHFYANDYTFKAARAPLVKPPLQFALCTLFWMAGAALVYILCLNRFGIAYLLVSLVFNIFYGSRFDSVIYMGTKRDPVESKKTR
ncbi:putative 1-acyl-sn-glycerol-3-phosphate acyltransferase 5 [Diplonema papillatum]|nr:putative 1-acyl-sn-glycerol-3-phosphate acyltransferase 5 [Diplonema papillatum]